MRADRRAGRIASCDPFGGKLGRWKQKSAAAHRRPFRTCAFGQQRRETVHSGLRRASPIRPSGKRSERLSWRLVGHETKERRDAYWSAFGVAHVIALPTKVPLATASLSQIPWTRRNDRRAAVLVAGGIGEQLHFLFDPSNN
jgi:hypothetical protein